MESELTRRDLLASLGVATTAALVPGASAGSEIQIVDGDWPGYGYDRANTHHNPSATGPAGDVGPDWVADTGNGELTSPAVADGRVYVGSGDGSIYARSGTDGESEWTVSTGAPVRSTPAIADDTLYVGSDDGSLYAIDSHDGAVLWTFETGGAVRSSPAVADGLVYVGSDDGTVYALDPETESEEWAYETEAAVDATPALASTDDGTMVYVGSGDGRVYALDAETGTRQWAFRTDEDDAGRREVTVAGGRVYVGSTPNRQRYYAVHARTGDEIWREQIDGGVSNAVAFANGQVSVPLRSGSLVTFDTGGTERWTFDAGTPPTSPAVGGSRVYVATLSGTCHALDLDGEEIWTFDTETEVQSGPVVAGDRVYVGTRTGEVFALAAGGDAPFGADNGDTDDNGGGFSPGDATFLLWPASAVGFVAAVVGGWYAAGRLGLLDRIEDAADAHTADPEEVETGSTPIWDLVVQDVIARADETTRTATQDLLVTKYVDSGTLEAPVVAFEVESLRDDAARIRLVEPRFETGDEQVREANDNQVPEVNDEQVHDSKDEQPDGDDDHLLESRPLGDNWTVTDDGLVFEGVVEPGETLRTLVGRPDCPDERVGDLSERPSISISDGDTT